MGHVDVTMGLTDVSGAGSIFEGSRNDNPIGGVDGEEQPYLIIYAYKAYRKAPNDQHQYVHVQLTIECWAREGGWRVN